MSDLISRQAAIDRATKEHDFFRGAMTASDKARRDELLNVVCWLGELPTIKPRAKGHWIRHDNADIVEGFYVPKYECSECHAWKEDDSDYCPNCGADMRGEEE